MLNYIIFVTSTDESWYCSATNECGLVWGVVLGEEVGDKSQQASHSRQASSTTTAAALFYVGLIQIKRWCFDYLQLECLSIIPRGVAKI